MAVGGRRREQQRPSKAAQAWRGTAGSVHSRSTCSQFGGCPVGGVHQRKQGRDRSEEQETRVRRVTDKGEERVARDRTVGKRGRSEAGAQQGKHSSSVARRSGRAASDWDGCPWPIVIAKERVGDGHGAAPLPIDHSIIPALTSCPAIANGNTQKISY
jgi:hypothetical protein